MSIRLSPNSPAVSALAELPAVRWEAARPVAEVSSLSNVPDRLVQAARTRLECSPTFRGRGQWIRFSCEGDCLVLDGFLPSYYLKQLAQEAVRDIPGVGRIDNRIAVASPFSLNPVFSRSCEHE